MNHPIIENDIYEPLLAAVQEDLSEYRVDEDEHVASLLSEIFEEPLSNLPAPLDSLARQDIAEVIKECDECWYSEFAAEVVDNKQRSGEWFMMNHPEQIHFDATGDLQYEAEEILAKKFQEYAERRKEYNDAQWGAVLSAFRRVNDAFEADFDVDEADEELEDEE